MDEKLKSVLQKAGAAALLIGGACASTHFGSPIIAAVVGGIFSNLGSSRIDEVDLGKIREILSRANPAELNHDIEKLIQEALIWTNDNIAYNYEAYCTTEEQKKKLKEIGKGIKGVLENADKGTWSKTNALLNQINQLEDNSNLLDMFIAEQMYWEDVNPGKPFGQYFKDNFLKNFQLCFGELLKKPERHAALVAYNRNISNQIQKNIQENQTALEALLVSNKELKAAVSELTSPKKQSKKSGKGARTKSLNIEELALPHLEKKIDDLVGELRQQVIRLIDINLEVLEGVRDIRKESELQTQALHEQGKKLERNTRNVTVYAVVLPILAITVAFLLYRYWQSRQPFVFTVSVKADNRNTELPYDPPLVTLRYGDKKESLQMVNNEAVFKGLPPYQRGDSLNVIVTNHGFYTLDTTVIADKSLLLHLRRDDTYGFMKGMVKDAITQAGVAGAIVMVQDIQTVTDVHGRFTLVIPEQLQKQEHRLIIHKAGYISWDRNEPVIKNAQIVPLLKKK